MATEYIPTYSSHSLFRVKSITIGPVRMHDDVALRDINIVCGDGPHQTTFNIGLVGDNLLTNIESAGLTGIERATQEFLAAKDGE